MRKLAPWIALLSSFALDCSTTSNPPPPTPTTRTLVILHTTDEHSHLLGFDPEADDYPPPTTAGSGALRGGIGRRMTVLARERASAKDAGAATLTLSAGDNVMGTLASWLTSTRAPDWAAMKWLGYDATTFGNHAFDYGPAALASSIAAARAGSGMVPVVMTNVRFSADDAGDDALAALFDDSGTDATKPVHRATVLTASNGLRVGLVGVMGASAADFAKGAGPVSFSVPAGGATDRAAVMQQIYADLQPIVDRLRNDEHVDLVVALSHAGLDATGAAIAGEDRLIAENVSGIDVVVSGHTHQLVPLTRVTNAKSGKTVWLQQAGSYGDHVGRIVVAVAPDGSVTLDESKSALLAVDDRTVPDPGASPLIDDVVRGLESERGEGGQSLLERALSHVEDAPAHDDPAQLGDLYFRRLAATTFDVPGLAVRRETPLMVLASDAMLAASEANAPGPSDVSVVASGLVFADLARGRTGSIAFADVVRALPLGVSPADGSPGYPLVRFAVMLAELKAALEVSAGYAYDSVDAADYFLIPSGVRYEYDTGRPTFDPEGSPIDPNNGRVTKVSLCGNHDKIDEPTEVLFDLGSGGWKSAPTRWIVVTTSLYVAAFAESVGVTIRDPSTKQEAALSDLVVRRTDGSEVKDVEALGWFIRDAASREGGALPSRYDAQVPGSFPRRALCSGPLCAPSPDAPRTR